MTIAVQSETLPAPSSEASPHPQAQAAAVVLAYLENTQLAVRHKAFQVLKELAIQTIARVREGKPTDITTLNLKTGVAPDTSKEPSAWLSPHWSRLVDEEKEWHEGMVEVARREGMAFIPRLEKLLGNPSVYRIHADPIPDETMPEPVPEIPKGGIYYTPESVAAPGAFLNKALRAGVIRWSAMTRWSIMLAVMSTLIGVMILTWLLLYFSVRISRPLSPADLSVAFVVLMLVVSVVSLFRFFGELFELRIVMAPTLLTPLSKDNVTLELRPSTEDSVGALVFVRYSSTCPICNGSVELFDGSKDFPGRIVGRCRRSAREHVYSFDLARKIGRPLRETAI
ncbi:hypothetical protein ACSFBF_25195 [Variovorax sp. ZT5P49]|uniref:hypothetical protein n=1 Tax=Variovorax sp. ZT5P49 TaxID=3443733 RepID=UPI003F4796FB